MFKFGIEATTPTQQQRALTARVINDTQTTLAVITAGAVVNKYMAASFQFLVG